MTTMPYDTDLDNEIGRVSELEKKCREALSYDSVRRVVRKKAFNELCALLDFIGDSDSALLSVSASAKRIGLEPYFLAYGILQLIYARQVSLNQVLKTFGLIPPSLLKQSSVSEARDRIIGHPITSNGGAHVIIRNSLDHDGFEYASYYEENTERGKAVAYQVILAEHLKAMIAGLDMLFQHLAEIENRRRQIMKQNSLSPIFRGIDYRMHCIGAALVEDKYGHSFEGNAACLMKALEAFRDGLSIRYGEKDAASNTAPILEGVRMLQELFPPSDERSKARYEIIADGVEAKLKKLIQMAADIDEQEAKVVA